MDLSIIIVSWKVKEKLKNNLIKIFASDPGLNFEVFVVDNNSGDGTVEMVQQEFPQVKLIANSNNLGFAKANNQAIKYITGRYVLLLNPDMQIFPDTLNNMTGWMDNHPEAWVAGCHLIDDRGQTIPQVRRFPQLGDQLAIVLKLPHLWPSILDKYILKNFDYNKAAKVDSLRGGFFMIRNEVLDKIGILDERFFIWFEEVDYCQRVAKAGGEVWYTPAAECVDYIGQSFKQVKASQSQKYFRDSMLKYFQKWHPGWQYMILKIAWPVGMMMATVLGAMKMKSKTRT